MKKKDKKIQEIIDSLATEWLGKKGVIAISDEEINNIIKIILFVKSENFDYAEYPKEYKGYEILLRKSKNYIPYGI